MPTIREIYRSKFGQPPNAVSQAPGRVNIIGEHTDYNGGFVLPTPTPLHTRCAVGRRDDDVLRAWSTARSTDSIVDVDTLAPEAIGGWTDYVVGILQALRGRGVDIRGIDLAVDSDLPLGGGLSSSAALAIAVGRAILALTKAKIDPVELAKLVHTSENEFVGAHVGIMDPLVCSIGLQRQLVLIDCRTIEVRYVNMPDSAALVVIDSGVRHANASNGYNSRRAECERACAALGVAEIRDLGRQAPPELAALDAAVQRRVRHVISENERVFGVVAALERDDLPAAGRILCESHASLRDDYEVSIPELDTLVELATATPGVYGARLVGGGFGGCVMLLTDRERSEQAARQVCRAYRERTGELLEVYLPKLGKRAGVG
jgi:galactokinase